jgi:hypothetical protein
VQNVLLRTYPDATDPHFLSLVLPGLSSLLQKENNNNAVETDRHRERKKRQTRHSPRNDHFVVNALPAYLQQSEGTGYPERGRLQVDLAHFEREQERARCSARESQSRKSLA